MRTPTAPARPRYEARSCVNLFFFHSNRSGRVRVCVCADGNRRRPKGRRMWSVCAALGQKIAAASKGEEEAFAGLRMCTYNFSNRNNNNNNLLFVYIVPKMNFKNAFSSKVTISNSSSLSKTSTPRLLFFFFFAN